jgi:hypothetical protein
MPGLSHVPCIKCKHKQPLDILNTTDKFPSQQGADKKQTPRNTLSGLLMAAHTSWDQLQKQQSPTSQAHATILYAKPEVPASCHTQLSWVYKPCQQDPDQNQRLIQPNFLQAHHLRMQFWHQTEYMPLVRDYRGGMPLFLFIPQCAPTQLPARHFSTRVGNKVGGSPLRNDDPPQVVFVALRIGWHCEEVAQQCEAFATYLGKEPLHIGICLAMWKPVPALHKDDSSFLFTTCQRQESWPELSAWPASSALDYMRSTKVLYLATRNESKTAV